MKVALIEDEPLAAEKLERYLLKYDGDITVLAKLSSLEAAIPWIRKNQQAIDLFFMDVQLSDGLSFEIFSNVEVTKPVVFTTAFDEFAIDAFKVNSIDYLLKPITFTDLSRAIKKLKKLQNQFSGHTDYGPVVDQLGAQAFKDRFLVRIGNHIRSVMTKDISYFYAEGRDVFLIGVNGKKYLVDYTLEALQERLSPKNFMRVNRSYIVEINAIEDVLVYSNRRLKLSVRPKPESELIVSREKVTQFKRWFEGG